MAEQRARSYDEYSQEDKGKLVEQFEKVRYNMIIKQQEREQEQQAQFVSNNNRQVPTHDLAGGPKPPPGFREAHNRNQQREARQAQIRDKADENVNVKSDFDKAVFEKAKSLKLSREKQNQNQLDHNR